MTTTISRLVLTLSAVLAVGPAFAEHEAPDAHEKGAMRTIVLEVRDVRPSTTKMSHGDVLSFMNLSIAPIQVTFTEPKDIAKHIRCGLVREKADDAPAAPWALFSLQGDKLVATVPPGHFASVCSLEPGRYTFTTEPIVSGDASTRGSLLPAKAEIEVQ